MSIWVYHLKKCEKNWGSPCWLRSGRPKWKLPSQLRKIVKATKRYGVKAMNLSARSNILRNIFNALEMILNHQRAIHFIWQCCQGKTWSIPSLAVCGKSVILGQFGVDVPMQFLYDFQEMLFWVHTFKNCDKNWGSPGLFRSYSAKCKQQSQLRKIVNTTRRYVLRKKFLTLSLCWIFSFVDTCRYYWEHISRSFCWTEMINFLCWS